ncbi:MAG TPA: hypothetical protein VGU43_02375 [Thermoplasmata archaeon]|nr:hypothetical protein [Thermoplasmata archaeon]
MGGEESAPAALAQRLLGTALRVRAGENVVVETWNHTLPYALACVLEARRRGAHPILHFEDEGLYWRSIDSAPSVARWATPGGHEWAALDRTHAYVFFPGPADRPRLRALPPGTRVGLTGFQDEWYRRARRARLRAVRSALGYASEAQAEHWGVSASTWRGQLLRGALDPEPEAVVRLGKLAARKLAKGRVLRITAPNGTDCSVKLRGRAPVVDDGVVGPEDLRTGQNMAVSPPGSVVVAIDERSADGLLIANRPSFLPTGRAEGGQWEFRQGRLVNSWFTEGQAAFDEAYQAAPKGKDQAGLFSIGINPALPPATPQVEDQEEGAVTLAIGGNRAFGGSNRCPFLSWIVVGEATVAIDGMPLADRGKLL